MPRATSTASAAPPVPAQRASRCRSATASQRGDLHAIERLTNQRIAIVPTPASEDMPAAPPSPRAEREAHDNGERDQREGHFRRGPGRPGGSGGRPGGGGGRSGGGQHRPFGDRSRGDRPPAPAEHQFRGGDYRDQPQGDRPQGDNPPAERPYSARPHANRPYTPRPPQGDRPSVVRRVATVAAASAVVEAVVAVAAAVADVRP